MYRMYDTNGIWGICGTWRVNKSVCHVSKQKLDGAGELLGTLLTKIGISVWDNLKKVL